MIDTVALIANGELYSTVIGKYSYVVAVDGGLVHCDRLGVTPDLLLGDFDSTPPELLEKYAAVEKVSFPRDKDFTDLELALQLPRVQKADMCHVYGACGGTRSDHFLGNLFLLHKYPNIVLEGPTEHIRSIQDKYEGISFPGQRISLFALGGETLGVNSQGLKWELKEATLSPFFFSISNECLGHVFSIQITKGSLILVQEYHVKEPLHALRLNTIVSIF